MRGNNTIKKNPADDCDALGSKVNKAKCQNDSSTLSNRLDGSIGDASIQRPQSNRPDGSKERADNRHRNNTDTLELRLLTHDGEVLFHCY